MPTRRWHIAPSCVIFTKPHRGFDILVDTSSTIHIEPSKIGIWQVLRDGEKTPISVHQTATDAEREACALARKLQCRSVLVHDRYRRVREISVR
jgi:hypothetical protein